MPKKETALKHATILSAYLLVVWGFYRHLLEYPIEIEELVIKPILWLVPIYYLVRKEKKGLSSIGITGKNFFKSIYLALALGAFFALEGALVNVFKYGGVNFSANLGENVFLTSLGISFATAISEEVAFRGFIFNRIWHALGKNKEWTANFISSLIWALVHVPVAVFRWNLGLGPSVGMLILITIFGIGSAYIFARTKNVASSVFLHVLWEWPIILFR